MKKLLNTLYITKQGSYLHKKRETLVIKQGDEKLAHSHAYVSEISCASVKLACHHF